MTSFFVRIVKMTLANISKLANAAIEKSLAKQIFPNLFFDYPSPSISSSNSGSGRRRQSFVDSGSNSSPTLPSFSPIAQNGLQSSLSGVNASNLLMQIPAPLPTPPRIQPSPPAPLPKPPIIQSASPPPLPTPPVIQASSSTPLPKPPLIQPSAPPPPPPPPP